MNGELVEFCTHPRAQHRHGTYAAYCRDKCHCDACGLAKRRKEKAGELRRAQGSPAYVDPTPARRRLQQLLDAGLTLSQIEQATGVHRTGLRVILGTFPGRSTAKGIRPETATKILSYGPATQKHGLVDPTGTRRRLQALVAIGWTQTWIAAELGVVNSTVRYLLRGDAARPVLVATRDAVAALYARAQDHPAPPSRQATRACRIAARHGWAPPTAWDPDELDDPQASPYDKPERRRDLIEDVEWLAENGELRPGIAARLGVSEGWIVTRLGGAGRDDLLARITPELNPRRSA